MATFINAVISFLLIAAAVYYFVVLPVNALMKRFEKQSLPDKKKCPQSKEGEDRAEDREVPPRASGRYSCWVHAKACQTLVGNARGASPI